jgi:spermidine synthase
MHRYLYLAFALSGAAGLVYEAVWGRYLALFVGHSAYAQVLVMGTYLGGMAVGALMIGERARRIRRPLVWYAWAEAGLALAGLLFHFLFQGATALAYDVLIPSLGSPALIGTAKWVLAVGILLPQAVLLGTTFPLMSSGFIRGFPGTPGKTLSLLYFTNSFGAAIGVLVGGFLLIGLFGLPGSLATAAVLNLVAAGVALSVHRAMVRGAAGGVGVETPAPPGQDREGPSLTFESEGGETNRPLVGLLLGVSFLTAVASFAYEIGWIRMLSLVMGSATHSFEVMLSAFILGLALGAFLIRRRADEGLKSLSYLGWIQWFMGLTALGTLPVYASTFESMAFLVEVLPPTDSGYALFGLARYGIAIAIMLPSTIMAGMTLPLITSTLLRSGAGEGSIGWVYGVNTLGSVVGVALAGLVALPILGLKGLILAGALLDMGLGVVILALRGPIGVARGWRLGPGLALLGALAVGLAVQTGLSMDQGLLVSGVFRYGALPERGIPILFYKDGRTATVGVHVSEARDLAVLTTNGKPDASISLRWIRAQSEPLSPQPILYDDEATQTLLALIPLAHRPGAISSAQIGHGSGLTGHAILASSHLERSVTIEIEPEMITASEAFYPANARVFDDPRSSFAIDDAKAYFASRQETFDLIISEPSNPWVSGVSSLFTVEFYDRVSRYLTTGGLFAQWIQCYEMSDALVATVLASLHEVFPHYVAFQVGPGDILIMASKDEPIPQPDWSVFQAPDVSRMLSHVFPLTPRHLDALRLFDETSLGPFLEGWDQVNSDFFPILDLEAEKARFKEEAALSVLGMGGRRILLSPFLRGEPMGFLDDWREPILGMDSFLDLSIGSWVRWARTESLSPDDAPSPGHGDAFELYSSFSVSLNVGSSPPDWREFMLLSADVEGVLHGGTAGVADSLFYGRLFQFLSTEDAPVEARAAADLLYGMASWEHERTLAAVPILMEAWRRGEEWVPMDILRDAGVLAYLAVGDSNGARELMDFFEGEERVGGSEGELDIPLEILRVLVERGALPEIPGGGA